MLAMLLLDTSGNFTALLGSCSKFSKLSRFSLSFCSSFVSFSSSSSSSSFRPDNSRAIIVSISGDSLSDGSTNITRLESVFTKI